MANYQSTKTGAYIEGVLNQFAAAKGNDSTGIFVSGGSNTVPGVFSPVSSPSHIGMIIHTTTLDTEDKVKAVYGGTTWILHQGYFLYGAESGATVVPNQAVATGGSKDATLVSHSHSISLTSGNNSGNHTHSVSITSGNQSANHTHSVSGNTGANGSSATGANMPPYKNVYIWERTA